jgi:hypothetical protein
MRQDVTGAQLRMRIRLAVEVALGSLAAAMMFSPAAERDSVRGR